MKRSSSTLRIAVAIDLDWPLKRHHEVFSGIQDYGKREAPHWAIVPDIFPAKWAASREASRGYDAIIGRVSASDARAAKRAGIPIVNVWLNSPVCNEVPSVLVDSVEVGRMAAEHLVSRGLRRIALVGYRADIGTQQVHQGILSVTRDQHIPVTRHLTTFSNSRNEANWHRFLAGLNEWMDTWRTPIGVACTYDNSARVVATECLRRGLRIPEDVAIIGANDDPMLCESSDPELSSIDMGFYREGYRAAELLDHLLRGGDAPTGPILTPPADLVPRQSTDVYTVDDKTVGRAMRYMAEHCGSPIRVGDVAAYVGCSRTKLERHFRQAGRRTINQEIVALRIELTKRLLVSTEDAIEDVAAAAGYGTAQHMRHVFRHQVGMSPTTFREKHRK